MTSGISDIIETPTVPPTTDRMFNTNRVYLHFGRWGSILYRVGTSARKYKILVMKLNPLMPDIVNDKIIPIYDGQFLIEHFNHENIYNSTEFIINFLNISALVFLVYISSKVS